MSSTKQHEQDVRIDVNALKALIEKHPEEFRKLLDGAENAMHDKYGRTVKVTDKVVTPAGEAGMVIRLDKNSKRVLIKLDDPADPAKPTRMLMAHRVEVRRGRPRKHALKIA